MQGSVAFTSPPFEQSEKVRSVKVINNQPITLIWTFFMINLCVSLPGNENHV